MDGRKIIISTAILILAAQTIVSCTYIRDEVTPQTCSTTPSFSVEVQPIVQMYCAYTIACHGSGSINGPGPLTSYLTIKASADLIKNAVVSRRMPLGSSLPDQHIQTIKCWIELGSLNN